MVFSTAGHAGHLISGTGGRKRGWVPSWQRMRRKCVTCHQQEAVLKQNMIRNLVPDIFLCLQATWCVLVRLERVKKASETPS